MAIRRLLFKTTGLNPAVGPLVEALRWGEPAYLTQASKSGSTIRIGWTARTPDRCAVYFNYRTSLVETFRSLFADVLTMEGARAIVLNLDGELPEAPLAMCLAMALTYHLGTRTTSIESSRQVKNIM